MSSTLIIILALIAILIAIGMMVYFLTASKKETQNRALAIIAGQAPNKETEGEGRDRRRAELAKKLQQKNPRSKRSNGLREKLNQAGLEETSVSKFWAYSAFSGIAFAFLIQSSGQPLPVILMVTLIGLFGFPRFLLKVTIGRRQKKCLNDFPDALEAMVRLLKASMPVAEAIAMMSREFTGPVGEEMSKVYEQQKIGIPLSEACLAAAVRMPITEMQMFATGISIQQQTGSSLSEVLLNLSRVIRSRHKLKRKIQALSAEAKASAAIIGSLPILVFVGLCFVNPEYMEPLIRTTKGKLYLGGAGTWMCMGVLVMRQMINFRI